MNIFKSALQSWIDTWNTNRPLFWLELNGCVAGICAAITINVLVTKPPMLDILSLYFISALCLIISSYIRKSTFMMLLMTFYAILSIIGICNLVF